MAVNKDGGNGYQAFGPLLPRVPEPPTQKSFVPEYNDDNAIIVNAGGTQGAFLDLDSSVKTEADLIKKYRELAMMPEIDRAIDEIVNQAVVVEDDHEVVEIVLDHLPVGDNLKNAIHAEFNNIITIIDFREIAYELFYRWYVEGRLYFHAVIDEANPGEGIKELRYIDPTKIRKVREVFKYKDPKTDAVIQKTRSEYYIYNETGLSYGSRVMSSMGTTGIRITKDAIVHVPSGKQENGVGLSYLHTAIRAANMYKQMEDSTLIYFYSRAPERRIFYVDVGNLPKIKAEQFVRDQMTRQKNKLTYDAQSGEIRDDRKFMTFIEDWWFPRRGDQSRGTEVVPMQGGTQLSGLLEAVEVFQRKVFRSLKVPMTRLEPEMATTLGRASEMNRDESLFGQFVSRLQSRFNQLWFRSLERQLIMKGICTDEDWDQIKRYIRFKWHESSFWKEAQERELMQERLMALQLADPYIFKYFSPTWVRKTILKQSDEEIFEMDQQTAIDMQNPLYAMPTGGAGGMNMFEEEDDQDGPPPKSKK